MLSGDDRVKVLALAPPIAPRVIGVVWHRDRHRSPAARAFVETAAEVSAAVERELAAPRVARSGRNGARPQKRVSA